MSLVDTSPEKIREFVRYVRKLTMSMTGLNENLLRDLKALEASFKDEGIEIVRGNVNSAQKELENALPYVDAMCSKLMAYADATEAARRQL